MDIVLQQGPDLIQFYRDNPCIAAYELLGVDLAPIQRIMFEAMWFKPYTLAICGRGAGKSSSIYELASFNREGLVYLHEILPSIPKYLSDGEDVVIDYCKDLYTSEGFRPIKKLCLEKGIKGKQLETQNGMIKRGSDHHPLLTIDIEGNFTYKTLADFKIGDRVCIQRAQNAFGNSKVSIDTGYLIGLLIGDGSYSGNNPVTLTSADESIIAFCASYCSRNNIGYSIRVDKRSDCVYIFRFSYTFNYFFDKYNIPRVLSYDKAVPYSIRTANKEAQIAFLQGYFDTDGTANSTGGVSCCSVSKKLLSEVQMMLLNLGMVSRLRTKKTKSIFGKAYLLDMYSEDSYKFKELVGFRVERKQTLLDSYFSNKTTNVNKDTIPYILQICKAIAAYYNTLYNTHKKPSFNIKTGNKKELTYSELHRFLLSYNTVNNSDFKIDGISKSISNIENILKYHYYFDTVVSIEDWQGDCYDFEMDMGSDIEPNYMTNGFINHNTFMSGLLATLLCLLYPGYRAGLIAPSFRQSLVKSSTYDTFWTSKGMVTSTDAMYDLVQGDTEIYTQSLYSQNKILSKWLNPDRDCIGIKTTKGFELQGTADHAIVVLNTITAKIQFVDLADLNIGDYVLIKQGFNYFANDNILPDYAFKHAWRTKDCNIPTELTPELAYLFGLLIGDGCISIDSSGRKYRVMFTSADAALLLAFEALVLKYFNITPTDRTPLNRTPQIAYYCKKLVNYLLQCGFTKTTALDKKIPDVIKKSSKECFVNFIQGLLDTDGSCYIQQHKNGSTHCEISLSTSSIQLAKEVQSCLLNIGIVAQCGISTKAGKRKLLDRGKYSVCNTGYKVRITGRRNLEISREIGLFKLTRKKELLDGYVSSHFNERESSLAIDLGLPAALVNTHPALYNQYLQDGFHFVKVTSKDHFFAPTMDIEVDNESCYFSSGFISHNSKMIFAEVEKLYTKSAILKEATEKRPIRGSDTCYLKFKSVAGHNNAFIEALPIGADGAKIRGSRFYCILVDEFAQVPQKIIETVLAPMSITKLDPMVQVRELERKKRLIAEGLATDSDFEEDTVNKMIGTSSGYYKFNHMYKRMRQYWNQIEEGSKDHAVFQIPYTLLPEGFLDPKNVENSRRVMSSHEFDMEYMAAMVSDSEGFFKASLLEDCTNGSNFDIELSGDKSANYIIGIDPNQGGKAKCGVVVIKLGKPNRIVRVLALDGNTTQDVTVALQDLCKTYNTVRIYMDRGGGGKAVADLLEEGYNEAEPIINRGDKDKAKLKGRHILELTTFSTSWIADANFATLSLFEDKHLLFPSNLVATTSELKQDAYELMETLKKQCLNIIVTQTSSGALHFDTPKKGQNKDIYSALILAGYGVKALEHEFEDDEENILYGSSGLVRSKDAANWRTSQGTNTSTVTSPHALLTRRN
jgi:intein/homing endonuclease